MPLPTPNGNETQDEFVERCMGADAMKEEYPDKDQRLAVCFSQWKQAKKASDEPKRERLALTQDMAEIRMETRRVGDKPVHNLVGYAAVFYDGTPETEFQLYDDMVERIMPGAFDKVLAAKEDVRGLFNHDESQLLGRTAAGTMSLKSDDRGLLYNIRLGKTTVAKDVAAHVKRGDVDGSSFAFRVRGQEFKTADGVDIREITEVGPLFDVGPVTFPAYTATVAGYRDELDIAREVRAGIAAQKPKPPKAADDPETLEWFKRVEEFDKGSPVG